MIGPNPPRFLMLEASSATSLDVSWLGQSGQGDVDLFLVSHFPAEGIILSPLGVRIGNQQRVNFENLLPSKDYVVTIVALSGDVLTSETSEEITDTFTTGMVFVYFCIHSLHEQLRALFIDPTYREGKISVYYFKRISN